MALLRGDRHLEAPILVNWRACVTTRCPVRLGDGNPRAPPESGSSFVREMSGTKADIGRHHRQQRDDLTVAAELAAANATIEPPTKSPTPAPTTARTPRLRRLDHGRRDRGDQRCSARPFRDSAGEADRAAGGGHQSSTRWPRSLTVFASVDRGSGPSVDSDALDGSRCRQRADRRMMRQRAIHRFRSKSR